MQRLDYPKISTHSFAGLCLTRSIKFFSHWISGKYLSQVFVLSKLRTWALNRKRNIIIPSYLPDKNFCVAGLQTRKMAAAGEGRWPNVKEQYELQEVIGAIFMLYYAKTLAFASKILFSPKVMELRPSFKLHCAFLVTNVSL